MVAWFAELPLSGNESLKVEIPEEFVPGNIGRLEDLGAPEGWRGTGDVGGDRVGALSVFDGGCGVWGVGCVGSSLDLLLVAPDS